MSENKNDITEKLLEINEYECSSPLLNPIELELDSYNQEDFMNGINDASYIAGYITAMLNVGVSEDFVLTYLMNKETIEYNLQSLDMSNKTNLEISKVQKMMLEKQEL